MTQTSLSPVVRHIRKLVGADAVRELSDTELLERFIADREERAFAALLRRHGPLVWSVCWQVLHHRQDAEDAFQATFLLLARQAASIRRTEAVPSWLYRVAYRVATKARVNMARQRFQERQVERGSRLSQPCHTVSPPEAEAAWRELQAVLNEELERLPEKYRAPFLMCCLDGKTGPEAARQLGWKLGTLTSRLTEARRLLQRRLARRGVMLSAVLAAATVARQGAAVASVALAEGTVKAALAFTGHATTAGLVSANAVALVEGMAPKLLVTKLKVATALLLAATVATGTGIATHQALAEKAAAPPSAAPKEVPKAVFAANDKAKPAETKQETKGSVVFGGRVLDPDGKPFAGAKLYLLNHASQGMRKKVLATSTSEGRFGFNVAEADVTLPAAIVDDPWNHVFVMAMAEGYGPAFKTVGKRQAAGDLTLQLAKDDVPIVGRILDLQGKPVAGVTVRVRGLYQAKQGDLAPFVEGLRTRKEGYAVHNDLLRGWYDLGNLYPTLTSDADGRFRLKNVGRERMVMLRIEGPSIETREVNVLTRPCETITVPEWKRNPEGGRLTYYGSTFNHAAPPSKPIVGVVRDKDTGKPIRGAIVQSYMIAGSNVSGRTDLTTVADMDGRYRLTGMPKGFGNPVRALPPDAQPYLPAVKNAATTPVL